MRKLWYAGAMVASGFLLFAAAPAQADVQPATPDAPTRSAQLPPRPPTEARPATGGQPAAGGRPATDAIGLPTVPGGGLPDVTGFPGGGMAVLAPAITGATDPAATDPAAPPTAATTVATTPAATAPAAAPDKHKHKPSAAATTVPSADPADPRLHEEPIDGEATRLAEGTH